MAIRSRSRRLLPERRVQNVTLDLFAATERATPSPTPPVAPRVLPSPAHLWLAVRFPTLPLVVVSDPAAVQAVVEGPPGRQSLVAVTAAARDLGLTAGLSRAAAEIRVPSVTLYERCPAQEAEALQARARAAFAFTPFVSVESPDTLLLEVQGSLRLFGGLEALLARVRSTLTTTHVCTLQATAPTVRAALWLSRAGVERPVLSTAELPGALAALPIGVTGFDGAVLQTCERMGVSTLGELMRLPRDGIARRLTPDVPRQLDEALGRTPQPRRRHVLAERFSDRIELPAEGLTTDSLLPWCEQLLAAQQRFLVQRDAAVAQCRFRFQHRPEHGVTTLVLQRSLPATQAAEWRLLLAERLGRLTLAAPVMAITLRSGVVLPAIPLDAGIGGMGHDNQAAAARLLDRLRARLGEEAVHGVCLVPEHRPEQAYARVRPTLPAVTGDPAEWPIAPRPLWLLATPQPLEVRAATPDYGGPLHLLSGPERIESGWWSGQGVARDYYVARADSGARVWIFCERDAEGRRHWCLHGVFA